MALFLAKLLIDRMNDPNSVTSIFKAKSNRSGISFVVEDQWLGSNFNLVLFFFIKAL